MKKGVIYARYSQGSHQTDRSIDGQVADCRAFAEQKRIHIIHVYADRHISGKSTAGRFEFLQMIDDAKKGTFDCVITWKIDRFGRDRRDIAIYKHELTKAGVQLLYAKESVPEGPEGIILESLLEGLAEYYSVDLKQKVIRGIREIAKKGEWTFSLPIGYTKDANRHIIIDEPKAKIVRKAFDMHIKGSTTKEIQQFFADNGILGQRGTEIISNGAVYRMLRNPSYMGIFEVQGIRVPAEPIITQEVFHMAAKNFKTSRNNAAATAKVDYMLSCKCYCGYCGEMLVADSGTGKLGKKYHYYKCKHTKGCELKTIPKNKLEDAVLNDIIEHILTDKMLDRITKAIVKIQDEAEKPILNYRKQLDSVRKKIRSAVTSIEDGAGHSMIARLNELEEKERELELQIAELELEKPRLSEKTIRAWLDYLRLGNMDDPKTQSRLIDTFVARVECKNGEIRVFYNISGKGSVTTSPMDQTGVEPVSKDQSPVLLLS